MRRDQRRWFRQRFRVAFAGIEQHFGWNGHIESTQEAHIVAAVVAVAYNFGAGVLVAALEQKIPRFFAPQEVAIVHDHKAGDDGLVQSAEEAQAIAHDKPTRGQNLRIGYRFSAE